MKKIIYYVILVAMRLIKGIFLVCGVVTVGTVACHAAGFLRAESFPGTFQDLSFETRMDVLAAGYDDVGVEYDANGRCVSGCAYKGITLAEEEQLIAIAQEELQQLIEQEQQTPSVAPEIAPTVQPGKPSSSGALTGEIQPGKPSKPTSPTQPSKPTSPTQPSKPSVSISEGTVTPSSYFRAPVGNDVIVVSDFGERRPPKTKNGSGSRYHRGLDLRASTGTPLYAAANGVVVEAGWKSGYGNAVVIEHPFKNTDKTVKTLYGHLSSINVKKGANVKQGDLIGKAGNSGNSGAAHLHYELRFNDMRVDPLGSNIKPMLDSGATAAAATRGTNYLGSDYCFKSGITSKRLAPYKGNDAGLRENFPGCRGWCH